MSKIVDSNTLALIFTPAVSPPPPLDGTKRWMDEGDIVSFSPYRSSFGSENTEFQINGRHDWLIWFSQLSIPLYNGNLQNPQICSFKLKDGTYIFPYNLECGNFYSVIKNRKFRVSIDHTPCFCVNKQSPKVQRLPFNEIEKIYEYVHKKISDGDMEAVRGMLKPARCYDLVEV